jgi:hypothetical protein
MVFTTKRILEEIIALDGSSITAAFSKAISRISGCAFFIHQDAASRK